MYNRLTAAVVAALIGLGGAAQAQEQNLASTQAVTQAQILASPPTYGGQGGPVGGFVTCRVFNAGLGSVSITLRQIITNTNLSVTLAADTCNVTLASTHYCAFIANILGSFAYSCRLEATASASSLRGVAEVSTSAGEILNTLPMR
jgi:hypothetical protein